MSDVSTAGLLEQLEAARIYDLSQPFSANMPQLPGAPRFHLGLLRRHGDTMRGDGYSSANELMVTIGHAGTHIDAIGHVSVDGRLYGGLSAEEVQRGTVGLSQLGIEVAAPIVRRAVLADVAGYLGVSELEPAFRIKADLLKASLAKAGAEVTKGSVVLVRTGWGQRWGDPERYVSAAAGLPGVDEDGAAWLAEKGIVATGSDTLMYEYFDPADNRLPVHCILIQGAGVHLIENMNLEALVGTGLAEFAIVVLPLRLVGATASQVRPIALA